jgi:2-amino-4-hydroxy-6-hydroxymethyldihydropteridine diphosphokinase
MGSNLSSWAGPPESTLTAAALRLESLGRIANRSSLYSTEPVGFAEQPRFINAVVALVTELAPQELLKELLAIEREFGRDRATGFTNGPRTLDLDILLFGDLRISQPGLEIPHPRLGERAFVLVPLNQIAPEMVDAESGKTVSQLLDNLHNDAEGEGDAVVPIQSDAWCAGARRDGVSASKS